MLGRELGAAMEKEEIERLLVGHSEVLVKHSEAITRVQGRVEKIEALNDQGHKIIVSHLDRISAKLKDHIDEESKLFKRIFWAVLILAGSMIVYIWETHQ